MKPVQLRSIELGSGRPKVCVPLVAATLDELTTRVAALVRDNLDIVELRVDYLHDSARNYDVVRSAIAAVRAGLPDDVPILLTFRTTREGGAQEISVSGYASLLETAVATGQVDAIDVEMATPRAYLDAIVASAHANGVAVVMSNHEFSYTPAKEEIIARLAAQQQQGADVVKIAVMPQSPRDVITLLEATEEFTRRLATVPVITMSMGAAGVVSRISGEAFGSCLTFGSVGQTSAPGQLNAAELRGVLDVVHRGLGG